jgi:NAD dependent epimerase/dehydratase family enzyme
VAPEPVTNRQFTSALGRALRRPAFVPVPAFALQALFGEMASVLLASQRVIPRAALDAGFEFRHPALGPALQDILRSNR